MSDDLERLLALLPDPIPTSDVVERHRRALKAVLESSAPSRTRHDGVRSREREIAPPRSLRAPARGSRWGRVAVAAGFVLLVACGVLVMALVGSPDRGNDVNRKPASNRQVAEPDGGCAAFAAEHPVDVPTDFSGPENRGVSDSPNPPSPDQLVQTWTSDSTEIEARWPADPAADAALAERYGADPPGVAGPDLQVAEGEIHVAPSGRSYTETYFGLTNLFDACPTVQVRVFDQDPLRVGSLTSWLLNHPFESGVPLVSSTERVDALPTAVGCPGYAAGQERTGPVEGLGEYPTPEAALRAYIEAHREHAKDDWVRFELADGSIAYGHKVWPPPGDDRWVAIIQVARSGDGWTVSYYEGC